MIKYIYILALNIFLAFVANTHNQQGHSRIELLTTGYNFNLSKIHLYNFLIGIFLLIANIVYLEMNIAIKYKLKNYISTRGGLYEIIRQLLKEGHKTILILLLCRQLSFVFLVTINDFNFHYYLFDTLSTYLTLWLISLCLIILKTNGFPEKISLFSIVSFMIILQYSLEILPVFSFLVISYEDWERNFTQIIFFKIIIVMAILLLLKKMCFLNNEISEVNT